MRRTALVLLFAVCAGCDHISSEGGAGTRVASNDPSIRDSSVTESERESIRQQIVSNWLVDPGMPDVEKMKVVVEVEMNPDGSVQSTKIEPPEQDPSPYWKKFAESCIRAVVKSSPLHMPADKPYEAWKHLTLVFDAKEMFGQ